MVRYRNRRWIKVREWFHDNWLEIIQLTAVLAFIGSMIFLVVYTVKGINDKGVGTILGEIVRDFDEARSAE